MTLGTPPHRWPVRIYYEDTDFSGVVYHAAYLRFLERGRTELLRHRGVDQSRLFATGQAFAVRAMQLDFRRAARMDDLVDVVSCIETIGGASIAMRQTIVCGERVLLEAAVRLGLVAEGRARRLPQALVDKLRATL